MATKKRVLLLSLSPMAEFALAPILRRADLQISKMAHPARSLELLRSEEHRLVLAGHPLDEISIPRLVTALRSADCASRGAGLFVVTVGRPPDELKRMVGKGINAVLPANAPPVELQRTAARLLDVAPRAAIRALVKVRVRLGSGESAFLAQTENISATGLLIRSDRRPEPGTRLPIELALAGESLPLRCVGEVVRHVDAEREGLRGFALRFVDLPPGDRLRIERAVERALDR